MAFEDAYAEVLSSSPVKGFYDQVNDDYLPVLSSLLPPGPIWRIEEGSEFEGLLRALAYALLRVEYRGAELFEEVDPRTTFELLDDWERVLDLPSDNPSPPTTTAGRRAAIHGKLLGHGDPTPQFFIDVAAGVGYTVVIEQKRFDPFVPGSVAGDPLTNGEWAFYWRVLTPFGNDDTLLEWLIEDLVPSHTGVKVVTYGDVWTERSNPYNGNIRSVTFGNDLFCAVGLDDATDAYIITSPNGIDWTERANPKAFDLFAVAYSPDLQMFAAVGQSDGVDTYIVTSHDCETWTERAPTVAKLMGLNGITWGAGLFVAVGQADGADAYLLTSPDGVTWTERTNPANLLLWEVDCNPDDPLFVAVGQNSGGDAYLITSPDGTTWTERANPQDKQLVGVAYSADLDQWCAVGETGYIVTSTDGVTWVAQTSPQAVTLVEIVWADGIWVAVGQSDGTDAFIITSPDGERWTEHDPTVAKNVHLIGVAYEKGLLVAVGEPDGADAYIVTSGEID